MTYGRNPHFSKIIRCKLEEHIGFDGVLLECFLISIKTEPRKPSLDIKWSHCRLPGRGN